MVICTTRKSRRKDLSGWKLRLAAALSGLLLLVGFSACKSRIAVSSSTAGAVPEKILVLPFQNMAERHPGVAAIRSPLGGKVFPAGPVMKGAETLLTDQVAAFLRQRSQYRVLSPGRARAAMSRMSLANEDLVPDREMIVRLGTLAGADAVVAGFVYRFRDRVGTDYGVKTPASVAFDLHLVQVPTGRLLWSAAVDESQRSLTEDLFQVGKFIQRKGRWITAPQMARTALQEALKNFP